MTFLVFLTIVSVLGICAGVVENVLKHQRKVWGVDQKLSSGRIEALEKRVEELTALVHEQTIALDGMTPRSHELRERVGR